MREEPLGIAQEGTLALHPSKLLKQGEGDGLRVRKLLERFVASGAWIEGGVGVVYETEESTVSELLPGERVRGYAGVGPSVAPCGGELDGPLFTPKPRNRHLGCCHK